MRRQPQGPPAIFDGRRDTSRTRPGVRVGWAVALTTAALACLLLMAVGTTSASAATGYESTGSFAEGNPSLPTAVAVDDSTGDVLVAAGDLFGSEGRVVIFEGSGPGATQIGEFGNGELLGPMSIAIDQTTGDAYVADAGHNRIVRYTRTSSAPPAYALDPTYVGPAQGSAPGQIGDFGSPLAIDPTNGDLLVADRGNLDVARFTPAGTFVRSFDDAGSEGGAFTSLLSLAVDPAGHIYTVSGEVAFIFETVTGGRVEKFSATGSPEGRLGGSGDLSSARSIAVDPHSGNVIVVEQTEIFSGVSFLTVYHGGNFVAKIPYPGSTAGSAVLGLAVDGGTNNRLYAVAAPTALATSSIQVFEPFLVPDVAIDQPTGIHSTGAHFSGTVNPLGQPTVAKFEYSMDKGGSWSSTSGQELGAGESVIPVSADVEDLIPNSSYEVRLTASNEVHQITSRSVEFSTPGSAPGVTTGPSLEVSETSAAVTGRVNPFGLNSSYYFEYGTTTNYGQQTPGVPGAVGNGFTARLVTRSLVGLEPGTTYHYRLVGANSIGTTRGADATFTTLSLASGPGRAYEQVSPVEKGLGTIAYNGFQALPSGDGLAYTTDSTMSLPEAESAPRQSRYVSRRGANGWDFEEMDPPMVPSPGNNLHVTLAVSEDLTHAFVVSNAALTPEAIEGGANLYVRNIANGALRFVAATPEAGAFLSYSGINEDGKFLGGSSDFSSIVFFSAFPLTPEATPGVGNLYRWSERDGLELVSIMPNGQPATKSVLLPNHTSRETGLVSADTERTVFALSGSGTFARLNNAETIVLSKSRVPGEPEEPQPGFALWMSRDGASAIFAVSSSVRLTTNAPATGGNLYEYVFATNELRYLGNQEVNAPIVGEDNAFAFSDDGSYTYLAAVPDLYVVHDGVVRLIGPLDPASSGLARDVSPNGHFLAFESAQQLTGYDNEGHVEIYTYDAQDEALTCASCPTSGQPSNGNAALPAAGQEFGNNRLPGAVTNGGIVFFDTPSRLLPADINGVRDVYSYEHGNVQLISPGDASFSATFVDASATGGDVFFKTAQSLVRQDDDHLFDIYDARVGGGIVGQNAVSPVPCRGEGCRASVSPPPDAAVIGSQAVQGRAAVKKKGARQSHARCRKKKAHAKGGRRCNRQKHGRHKRKPSKTANRRQGR